MWKATIVAAGMALVLAGASFAQCPPAEATVLARYQLDELDGIAAHDEVGGHNGTLVNGPTWDPTANGECGGGALTLDGLDDYVDIPGGTWDDFGPEQSFGVSCCFLADSLLPGTPHIIGRYQPSNDDGINLGYGIEFESGPDYPGHVWFSFRTDHGGGGLYVVSTDPYPPGVWHTACAIRDRVNDEVLLYVDGALAAPPVPDTFPEDQGLTQNHFVIGRTGDSDQEYFTGQVDRVEIFVLEPASPVESSSWGVIKALYK